MCYSPGTPTAADVNKNPLAADNSAASAATAAAASTLRPAMSASKPGTCPAALPAGCCAIMGAVVLCPALWPGSLLGYVIQAVVVILEILPGNMQGSKHRSAMCGSAAKLLLTLLYRTHEFSMWSCMPLQLHHGWCNPVNHLASWVVVWE